jgi:3-hydroxyisobutyrate dehydrogenase-like beta-hydroxyacid dehydrogenase
MKIALLHPGEMGGAIGEALTDAGREVHWASAGRSPQTRARAAAARLIDDVTLAILLEETDLVISVCPPHAALAIAEEVAAASGKRSWIYLDANAVAPATARRVARTVEAARAHYVDGGIIGPPPVSPGSTRLYLSGPRASAARDSLVTDRLDTRIIDDQPTSASALKLAYAAWTKGSSAYCWPLERPPPKRALKTRCWRSGTFHSRGSEVGGKARSAPLLRRVGGGQER